MFPVGDVRGDATAATVLIGLSVVVGIPKAALLGEFELDDGRAWRLLRNCCLSSIVLRC